MYYGAIKNVDSANGPGARVSLFVSGCTHHCKGCFQPQTWDFQYGKPFTKEAEDELFDALRPNYISGLTLLGGEPFEPENQYRLLSFLKRLKEELPEKTIWAFSGYQFDELAGWEKGTGRAYRDPETRNILGMVDVLVDGEFVEEKKNISLRFRGSENQRLIDVKKSLEAHEVILWKDWI